MFIKGKIAGTLALVIALGAVSGLMAQSSSAADALWDRARTAWSAGESYKPARMSILFQELDAKGAVKSSTLNEYSLSYPGGGTVSSLLRSIKDGKDVTEKARAEQRKQEARGGSGGDGRLDAEDIVPFSAKVAPSVVRGEAVMGTVTVTVPYEILDKKAGSVGAVTFGPSGDPLSLRYSLKPLPAMVSEMAGDASFLRLPDGAIVVSSFGFSGEGGILFVRMRFSVRMDFSGFFRISR